jgi:uncharacterized Ntn-hydrolase superfamily protein
MTFSIVAHCPRTGQVGVGALTAMAGVGKITCHAQAGAGAISTQAFPNPYHAYDAFRLLAAGRPAQEVLDMLLAVDPGKEHRQIGLVDTHGRVAVHSGSGILDWSGDLVRDGFAVQGNRLVGPETLEETARAFEAHTDKDLAERLLEALEAGEATGADKQGAVSGTIQVYGVEAYPLWDMRADHAEDPAAELRRLYDSLAEELLPSILKLPTRDDPLGQSLREQLEG